MKKKILLLLLFSWLISWAPLLTAPFSAGCSSPAAPPTPPAEIPTFLRFPDPTIDVSTISSTGGASALAALVGAGGEFSEEIAFGGDTIGFVNLLLDQFLFPLQAVEIPVSTDPTLEASFTSDPGAELETTIGFQFDFADFDFDGDGVNEGCSGHTAALPICFRIWFEGTEDPTRMGGVFTQFPTDDNPGVGRFKVEGILDLQVGVVYDHQDPENKSTELATRTIIDFTRPPGERGAFFEGHGLVTQVGPEASSVKLVNYSEASDSSGQGGPEPTGFVRYVGRFQEGPNFWSGSYHAENPGSAGAPPGEFSNVCAHILSGQAINPINCQDLGIDVTGISFIDFVTDADVEFPADFPVEPTF